MQWQWGDLHVGIMEPMDTDPAPQTPRSLQAPQQAFQLPGSQQSQCPYPHLGAPQQQVQQQHQTQQQQQQQAGVGPPVPQTPFEGGVSASEPEPATRVPFLEVPGPVEALRRTHLDFLRQQGASWRAARLPEADSMHADVETLLDVVGVRTGTAASGGGLGSRVSALLHI